LAARIKYGSASQALTVPRKSAAKVARLSSE